MATNLSKPEDVTVINTVDPLVLASASPRRFEILRALGFEFDMVPADIDEEAFGDFEPPQLAVTLAEKKADAVGRLRPDACVVAADTVVALEGKSLGKPSSAAAAVAMLQTLSGRTHEVHTGVAVFAGGIIKSGVETSHVTIRQLSTSEIEAYVESGAAMDKAGAYGIQDAGLSPVESYSGSYLNVVGLPVKSLSQLLLDSGQIDAATSARLAGRDSL